MKNATRLRKHLMAACALCALDLAVPGLAVPAALADPLLPSGGTVAAGSVSIITADPASTLVVQKSKSAIVNWQNFSIGAGASVTFQQPDAASIMLNRVTGAGISAIDGNLLANGQVWLVNANGILFGQGSRIDVGGLIATTSDIRDQDFLTDHYAFGTPSGNLDAAVINHGSIKAATGGSAVLSAAHVVNEGLIAARMGRVVLGGASAFSVDFDGDNLIRYQITAPVSQAPKDSDGKTASALVSNAGTVAADGGTVLMTARAARNVVDNVINTTGMIQANAVSIQNGEVVLDGGEDGTVKVAGTVDVSGQGAGETGGTIAVQAAKIEVVDGARLDASGAAGGGTIRIGGMDAAAGPVAQSVAVGKASIAADATAAGKGGSVAILSQGRTSVAATISAKGVAAGGMVETSGQDLAIQDGTAVDTSALAGATGLWLLDPTDVVIDSAAAANIVSSIASTNVSVTASNDITVNAAVAYTSANSLTLMAGHNLTVNANVQNGGAGAVRAVAGWDGVTGAANILTTPGAYGNNGGSILIGGAGASGRVALGSRLGSTIAAAHDLTIAATNTSAQLGYHGSPTGFVDTNGGITVALSGELTLTGGNASSASFAQIGHGGHEADGNQAGDITINAAGPVTLSGGSALNSYARIGNGGAHSIGIKSGNVILTSGGDITLNAGATLNAGGTGDALVLAATGDFVNQAGASVFSVTGGGRWLVFLGDPANNSAGGLSASPYYNRAFDFATDSYAPVTSAGNRFVYALAPMVTVTIADKTKTYGAATPTLTAAITGGLAGDDPTGVYMGAPVLATAATTGSDVGNYAITGSLGTLVSDFNYGFQFVSGTLHIDPAVLTASLTGLVRKTYDGTATATLSAANFQLNGIVAGDSVTLSGPNGAYDSKNAGTGKLVSVNGLTLLGSDKNNYVLASSSASAAIGVIDPALLTASLTGTIRKTFDGTATANLAATNYLLSGVIAGDSVATNSPSSGLYDSANAGTGKTVSVNGLALTGADKGNYSLAASSLFGAVGVIDPAAVTVSLTGTVQKVFDGNTAATLNASNYALSGVVPGYGVTLNNPVAGTYDSANAGTGKTVSVGGLALSGGGNYVLSSSSVSGAIGIITAAPNDNALISSIQNPTPVPPPAAPPAPPPVPPAFDATSAIERATLRLPAQTSSTSLLDGLLLLVRAPGNTPHGVPPYGQVHSSWGNEAFWQ